MTALIAAKATGGRASGAGSERGQNARNVVRKILHVEVLPGHGQVSVEQASVRIRQPRTQFVRSGWVEGLDPRGEDLKRDGVAIEAQRSAMGDCFDGGVAEPFPCRWEDDHVGRRIGIVDGPWAGASQDRNVTCRDDGIEDGAVAIFCRRGEPVGGIEGLGESDAAGHVLAGERPRRLEEEALVLAKSKRLPGVDAITCWGIHGEPVVEACGGIPAFGELLHAQLVDGDVPPRGVVGRQGKVGGIASLPGQIVMSHDGWTPAANVGHCVSCGWIQGQRAKVLHDDEVDRGEHSFEMGSIDWSGVANAEAGDDLDVTCSLAGHSRDLEAEVLERICPLFGLDRYAIGAAKAIRDDSYSGHLSMVRRRRLGSPGVLG